MRGAVWKIQGSGFMWCNTNSTGRPTDKVYVPTFTSTLFTSVTAMNSSSYNFSVAIDSNDTLNKYCSLDHTNEYFYINCFSTNYAAWKVKVKDIIR